MKKFSAGYMKMFTAGKEVGYNGLTYVVDHVMISGQSLMVCLVNGPTVDADLIDCSSTELIAHIQDHEVLEQDKRS